MALPGLPARADGPVPLTGEKLRQMVPGSSIAIDTPLSTVVPIHFTSDGLMTGEAGSLAAVLGADRDRGRWWVTGDSLCLKWFRWLDAEQRCLQLSEDGQRIFWQDDEGKTGTATLTIRGEQVAAKSVPAPVSVAAKFAPAPIVTAPAPEQTASAVIASAPPPVTAPVMASTDFGSLTIISRAEAATLPAAPPDTPNAAAAPTTAAARSHKPKSIARKPDAANKAIAKGAAETKSVRLAAKPSAKTPDGKAATIPKQRQSLYQVAGVDEDDVLNIRNGPSEDHDAVGAIPPTARGVKIVGNCEDDWCPVTHGSMKGWVNSYYLAPEPAPLERAGRASR